VLVGLLCFLQSLPHRALVLAMTIKITKREAREFAAMVRGDHPDQKAYREYVLAELRCAQRRSRLLVNEIEVIGLAFRAGMIDDTVALTWLAEANALEFLQEERGNDDQHQTDVGLDGVSAGFCF
jgi:hypothetical protein